MADKPELPKFRLGDALKAAAATPFGVAKIAIDNKIFQAASYLNPMNAMNEMTAKLGPAYSVFQQLYNKGRGGGAGTDLIDITPIINGLNAVRLEIANLGQNQGGAGGLPDNSDVISGLLHVRDAIVDLRHLTERTEVPRLERTAAGIETQKKFIETTAVALTSTNEEGVRKSIEELHSTVKLLEAHTKTPRKKDGSVDFEQLRDTPIREFDTIKEGLFNPIAAIEKSVKKIEWIEEDEKEAGQQTQALDDLEIPQRNNAATGPSDAPKTEKKQSWVMSLLTAVGKGGPIVWGLLAILAAIVALGVIFASFKEKIDAFFKDPFGIAAKKGGEGAIQAGIAPNNQAVAGAMAGEKLAKAVKGTKTGDFLSTISKAAMTTSPNQVMASKFGVQPKAPVDTRSGQSPEIEAAKMETMAPVSKDRTQVLQQRTQEASKKTSVSAPVNVVNNQPVTNNNVVQNKQASNGSQRKSLVTQSREMMR